MSGNLFDPGLLAAAAKSKKTFAQLADPAKVGYGTPDFIVDCNTSTFNAAAAPGGSNCVPVFVGTGLVWRVG